MRWGQNPAYGSETKIFRKQAEAVAAFLVEGDYAEHSGSRLSSVAKTFMRYLRKVELSHVVIRVERASLLRSKLALGYLLVAL